jgi:hypothetical protein
MSLFWPRSLRTCGGSHRWLLGHHPPWPCALRSVAVVERASGAGRSKSAAFNERPNRPNSLQPTSATKSANRRHLRLRANPLQMVFSFGKPGFPKCRMIPFPTGISLLDGATDHQQRHFRHKTQPSLNLMPCKVGLAQLGERGSHIKVIVE